MGTEQRGAPGRHPDFGATRQVRAEDIARGHMVYLPGIGGFAVREVTAGGPTGRMALLGWGEDLALLLRRGTRVPCLLPVHERRTTTPVPPSQATPTRAGPDRQPGLPLAG